MPLKKIPTRAEAGAAVKVGVFGIILIGLCSMSMGLLSRLAGLDPIVFLASMAGVMAPLVLVVAGALALWASENPGLFPERERAHGGLLPPLIAGLMTTAGAAVMLLLALAVPLEGILPSDRIRIYFGGLDASGYLELAVLLAAYVALAVIGGALYGMVVPAPPAPARYKR